MGAPRGILNDRPPLPGPVLPPGGQLRRLGLAEQRKPVSAARRFTVAALEDWAWPERDDVVLVVAELVANAVLHAGGAVHLTLDATPDRLRIEIADGSAVLPAPSRPHSPSLPGGHGLHVVDRTCDRWGGTRQPWGKTVWAEIDLHRS
ncbi:ATP-binding protein [Kitasatospora sp. NPDC096147]|uniref:ATP-binding protein n=1 Tax=Kitasatospora sp. NPDC096147 TaxID=3364093 RepID=UPI0038301CB5